MRVPVTITTKQTPSFDLTAELVYLNLIMTSLVQWFQNHRDHNWHIPRGIRVICIMFFVVRLAAVLTLVGFLGYLCFGT